MKSKYETHIEPNLDAISKMVESGVTVKSIAKAVGISYSTFREYIKKHTALSALIKKAKVVRDQDILALAEEGLISRLTPHWQEVEHFIDKDGKILSSKEKWIEPSDTALIFALKSLAPSKWNKAESELVKARKAKVEAETERIKKGSGADEDLTGLLGAYVSNE